MSMVHCDECERLIDSDEDPECFVELRAKTLVRCEPCRDVAEWCRERVEQNA